MHNRSVLARVAPVVRAPVEVRTAPIRLTVVTVTRRAPGTATRTGTLDRVRAGAAAAGAACALVTGCATGQQAQTANEVSTLDSAQGKVGQIQLETVALQAPDGASYAVGASVPLTVYLVNNGRRPDSLVDISSPSFSGGWAITASSSSSSDTATPAPASSGASSGASSPSPSASVGPGLAAGFGIRNLTPQGGQSEQTIVLMKLTKRLFPGNSVQLTFSFAQAGQTTLTVPVQLSREPDQQTLPGGQSSPAE